MTSSTIYGTTETNRSHVVILKSFELINDQDGLLSGFFRVITSAMSVLNLTLKDLNADTPEQLGWIKLFKILEQKPSQIDLSPMINTLQLQNYQGVQQVARIVKSLPQKLLYLFCTQTRCSGCGVQNYVFNVDQYGASFRSQTPCSQCGKQQQLACPPAMRLQQLSPNQTFDIWTELDGATYVLNYVGAKKDGFNYSILVDYQANSTNEVFILNAGQNSQLRRTNQQKIAECTFLKPSKVEQYQKRTPDSMVERNIGAPRLALYFDQNQVGKDIQANIEALLGKNAKPVEEIPMPAVYSPPPARKPKQITPEPEYEIEEVEEAQTIRQGPPSRFLRVVPCGYWFYVINGLSLLMCIISIIIIGSINTKLNTTFTADNIIAKNKSYIGLPQVQKTGDVNAFLQTVQQAPVPVAAERKQAVIGDYSIYTGNVSITQLHATNAKFASIKTSQAQCGQIKNFSSLICSQLTTPTLNLDNLTVQGTLHVSSNLNFGSNANLAPLTIETLSSASLLVSANANISQLTTNILNASDMKVANATFNTLTVRGVQKAERSTVVSTATASTQFTVNGEFYPLQSLSLNNRLVVQNLNLVNTSQNQRVRITFTGTTGAINGLNGAQLLLQPTISTVPGTLTVQGATTVQQFTGAGITSQQVVSNGTLTSGSFTSSTFSTPSLTSGTGAFNQITSNTSATAGTLRMGPLTVTSAANTIVASSATTVTSAGASVITLSENGMSTTAALSHAVTDNVHFAGAAQVNNFSAAVLNITDTITAQTSVGITGAAAAPAGGALAVATTGWLNATAFTSTATVLNAANVLARRYDLINSSTPIIVQNGSTAIVQVHSYKILPAQTTVCDQNGEISTCTSWVSL